MSTPEAPTLAKGVRQEALPRTLECSLRWGLALRALAYAMPLLASPAATGVLGSRRSSRVGLRRDLAITRALRVRMPDVVIEWLVEERLGTWLTAHDEIVHPSSRSLLSELRPTLLAGGEGRSYAAHRRHDEVRFANFMVFADVVAREPFDLVIADSAWHVDHYLHQNPELKRFAFAWLSDEVGFAPTVDESERDAVHRADANAEMIELVERYPRIRDLALFLGGSRTLSEESFGPGLPSIREWTSHHFELAADDPAAPAEATRIAELISRLI